MFVRICMRMGCFTLFRKTDFVVITVIAIAIVITFMTIIRITKRARTRSVDKVFVFLTLFRYSGVSG